MAFDVIEVFVKAGKQACGFDQIMLSLIVLTFIKLDESHSTRSVIHVYKEGRSKFQPLAICFSCDIVQL